ncbi:PSPH [Symbiodinium sp. KB8]|nr:PSPH [Symbiodinium sp. KB8]
MLGRAAARVAGPVARGAGAGASPVAARAMSAASEAAVEPCSKSDMTREEAKLAFQEADAVCFDVDSTVVTTEGVDEFAAFLGVGDKVAELTARRRRMGKGRGWALMTAGAANTKLHLHELPPRHPHPPAPTRCLVWPRSAMNGDMKFHEALDARLSIMGATAESLDEFVRTHPATFTPGVERLIASLQARGTHVYLVSGGFTQMIFPLADRLALPRSRVFANTILFGDECCRLLAQSAPLLPRRCDGAANPLRCASAGGRRLASRIAPRAMGEYSGFDQTAPTAWAGGKAKVIAQLRQEHGYPVVAMVGDGATDLEARPPADVFVGFGGIAQRPEVMANADLWVTDFADVQAILDEAAAATEAAEDTSSSARS